MIVENRVLASEKVWIHTGASSAESQAVGRQMSHRAIARGRIEDVALLANFDDRSQGIEAASRPYDHRDQRERSGADQGDRREFDERTEVKLLEQEGTSGRALPQVLSTLKARVFPGQPALAQAVMKTLTASQLRLVL